MNDRLDLLVSDDDGSMPVVLAAIDGVREGTLTPVPRGSFRFYNPIPAEEELR